MNMTDVKTLFDYNYWATTRVLRAAEHIRQDQFVAPLSGQTASLRDVLVHIMSAERLWRVRWETGSSPDALRAEDFPKLAALRQAPASILWWATSKQTPNLLRVHSIYCMCEQGATVKYKLVIFDFDGTIANSLPWFLHVANAVADTFKFRRIEESDIETLRGYSPKQVIRHLGVPMWKLPMIAHHVRALTAKNIDQIMLFEGADRLLRQLSDAGVTIAIVTSNSCANVRHVLGADHAALVTYYECGTSIFGKGSRFRRILRQSGVRPSEALCIGDEIRDLEAARKEQIPFGAVAWGFTNVEVLKAYAPAEVFAEVGEIAEAIL